VHTIKDLTAKEFWQQDAACIFIYERSVYVRQSSFSFIDWRIDWLIYLCIHSFHSIHSFIQSLIHLVTHSFTLSFIYSLIHSFYAFIHSFLFIHSILFIHSFIHSSIHFLFTHSFHSIHSFIHFFIHSSIHFIHSFIHSLIHSFTDWLHGQCVDWLLFVPTANNHASIFNTLVSDYCLEYCHSSCICLLIMIVYFDWHNFLSNMERIFTNS